MNDVLGAELTRRVQALLVDVDGDDSGAWDARILDREVAEAAGAEYRDEAGELRARDLHRLVRGHAGAGQRRGVQGVDVVGDEHDVARVPTAYSANPPFMP